MSKRTFGEVQEVIKELRCISLQGTCDIEAEMLTAYAERIKADEMAPVAWMIEWDSEDDGRKCCPRKGQDKPRLDCFPEGTTAYPLFATSQQTSAVPRRTGER